jgi:hypothetical protein
MPITKIQIIQLAEELASNEVTPAAAFALAERICDLAYQVQGGASDDPDIRDKQQQTRKRRKAAAFEQLYCRIRDMADDFQRESIRRRDGLEHGQFEATMCNATKALESTFQLVHTRVANWDY